MLTNNFKIPIPSVDLEQALTDIIESIASEDNSLSSILHSEGEIIQKMNNSSCNMDEYVNINESVNDIIKSVVRLQMLMQFELEDTEDVLKSLNNLSDETEE